MKSIDVTLVRAKETKEPVAVFEQQDDLVSLGLKVDEVIDPGQCQYADYKINMDFGILFQLTGDDHDEIIGCGGMTPAMADSISAAFKNKKIKWVDFPGGFDCLSTGIELDQRFGMDRSIF